MTNEQRQPPEQPQQRAFGEAQDRLVNNGPTQRASNAAPGNNVSPAKAEHGYRNEVSWDGGEGRQPYQNQGDEESGPPAAAGEFEAGNRGDLSGRNADQFEQASGTPGAK